MKYKVDQILISKKYPTVKITIVSINDFGYTVRVNGNYATWFESEIFLDEEYKIWIKPKLDYLLENV